MLSRKAILETRGCANVLAMALSGAISVWIPSLGSYSAAPVLAQTVQDRETEADRLLEKGKQQFQTNQYQAALESWQRTLTLYQAVKDQNGEAVALGMLGNAYRSLSQYEKASGYYTQALSIFQAIKDQNGEANVLMNLGSVYVLLSQHDKAISYYTPALSIFQAIKDRKGEADVLMSLGVAYRSLSQSEKAINYYIQALPLYQTIKDRKGEADVLNNLGVAYRSLSQSEKAISYHSQSLPLYQETKDRKGEAGALNNLGIAYRSLSQYDKVLRYYTQALPLYQTIKDRKGEADVLNNLGAAYLALSQYEKSISYHTQALPIFQAIKNRNGEALALNNLGFAYFSLSQPEKAINYQTQALLLFQAIQDRAGEAKALNNLGNSYLARSQVEKAIDYHTQALPIFQQVKDRNGEAAALSNLGFEYRLLSQYDKALRYYAQALPIYQVIKDRENEGKLLSNFGEVLERQKQSELAIVFYKKSVNVRESIRKDIRQLPKEQQATYTQSVESTYRRLADLLLKQNRIMEALQVLDLLKVQELQDYLRDSKGNALTEQKLPFLEPETQILQQLNPAIATKTLSQQLSSPTIQTRVQQLKDTAAAQNLTLSTYRDLQTHVQKLGKNIALFYSLILDDRLELVVFLPDRPPIHRTVAVPRQQLETTIQSFSKTLNEPYTWDVKPHAQQLYTWLIQPFAVDLQQSNVQTIVYAPDGQMRYVPLTALYDGQQWLTQRFQINYLTALALTPLEPRSTTAPRILAGAYAQGRYKFQIAGKTYEFNGLSFARTEIEQLAAQFPNTTSLFDKAFARTTILAQKERYNILHFATHAAFVPGKPEDSFIVLGDGSQINLREIADWKLPDTQLVVLSACQTAIGEKLGNGLEVLGFGYQLQRTGVRASIASLWSVNDAGTQTLMNNFYAILKASSLTETEALQKAQIALMTNQKLIDLKSKRGVVQPLELNQPQRQDLKSIGYSHPYYWAPFILIGNGL